MAPFIAIASALVAVLIPVGGWQRVPAVVGTILVGVVAQLLFQLLRNIQIARSTSLPYVLTPAYQFNMFSFVVGDMNWYRSVARSLPFGWGDWYDWTHDNYKWRRRRAPDSVYRRVGSEVYCAVSPGAVLINVGNPDALADLALKRNLILKPDDGFLDVLKVYGDNVFTASDEDWPPHRKFVSGIFNERSYVQVWRKTITQATECLAEWTSVSPSTEPDGIDGGLKVKDMFNDVQHITLNVISTVGLGATLPFGRDDPSNDSQNAQSGKLSNSKAAPGCTLTFRESILHIALEFIATFITLSLVPTWFIPFASESIKYRLTAYEDFGRYLRLLVDKARAEVQAGQIQQDNLLTSLVRQQQEQRNNTDLNPDHKGKKTHSTVSEEDILGNAYIITIAGYETTAASLQFAFVVLALHPEQQTWLLNSIDKSLEGQSENPAEWDYVKVFPLMSGPLSVMFEMLRLFPPAHSIAKRTSKTTPVAMRFAGKEYILPPNTIVELDVVSAQYNTDAWGPNAAEFQPWIWDGQNPPSPDIPALSPAAPGAKGDTFPNVHVAKKGTWVPFGEGHRSCVGQKFAQVEYVAILAVMLRRHRVELVREKGETRADAKKRVWKIIEAATQTLSLRMRQNVQVKLVAR
ncbi:cytochrome P450 [Peziza echinospora]|nr:cytochrome P450 [Peziza echinospora]